MHSFHCCLEKSLQKFRLEFLFNYPWNFISFFTKGWVRVHQFPRCTYKWHFTGLRGGKCDRVHQSPLDLINCQFYVYYLALKKKFFFRFTDIFSWKSSIFVFPALDSDEMLKSTATEGAFLKMGKPQFVSMVKIFYCQKILISTNGFGFFWLRKSAGIVGKPQNHSVWKWQKIGLFFITFVN